MLLTLLPAQPAAAASPCVQGVLPHGALSMICVPPGWNGDLVVYAHGYVRFDAPLGFHDLALGAGIDLPSLVQGLGFAFATTSYRQNGLAILEAQDDIRELVSAFRRAARHRPERTFLIGGSEGGLVTTLLLERSPQLFTGGIAACGPIGSFRGQIDYVGDFRVLFDVLFPNVLPGTATRVPAALMTGWEGVYAPRVERALAADPIGTAVLIRMSGASVDPLDPSTVTTTVLHLLWYSVFGTNDAAAKLGGNPYSNVGRVYAGSGSAALDAMINARAQRVAASPAALWAMRRYETSGRIARPLIAPHTTGDDLIPFWQEILYRAKLAPEARVTTIPIPRYGHCRFTPGELLVAFAALLAGSNEPGPDH